MKILIVEDCAPIADALAALLEKYGEIEIAENGRKALVKVALGFYDAVISDINMPVMGGIEFYEAAVAAEPAIKDRFMFYTSSFATEHINFFIDNDVPFLFKPARKEEIDNMICKIIDRSHKVFHEKNSMVRTGAQEAGQCARQMND